MSSRERILQAVRANRPDRRALPDLPVAGPLTADAIPRFVAMVESVGGRAVHAPSGSELAAMIDHAYPDAREILSTVDEYPRSTVQVDHDTPREALQHIDLVVLRGSLGVVENGAVWLADDALPHRALPFVTTHLVLLLRADQLVADMHGAYAVLQLEHDTPGFGVLVSGPSKTADIERALVIGAQGPRSLLVIVI